jgi:hypothetical protein
VAVLVIVAGALGAPATVASAASAASGGRCPRGTLGAVVTAYANAFSRATPLSADERAAAIAGGGTPTLRAILDDWLASPVGAGSTLTAERVHCRSRNRATVDTQLVLAGVPLPEVLPEGRAVRVDGTWKVATATFCRRMVLEDPSLAGACP